MRPLLILQLVILVTVANGAPVIGKDILSGRYAFPLDAGLRLGDGQRLFGPSKTIRGILLSILVTSFCALLIRLEWRIGFLVGSAAMAGDLLSSFVKRRLHLPAGARATGLDQVPESLFPLLACFSALSLTVMEIAAGVVIFFVGEMFLSHFLYKLRLRDRPY